MNKYLEILASTILGGVAGSLCTRVLIYKVIHPYIILPYLRKKETNKTE